MTMSLGTNYVSPENRVATSDARFDMRLTEKFDDDDGASGSGWIWVGAILLAGVLIVSGYLDQESANIEGTASAAGGVSYASDTSPRQTVVASAKSAERRSDKGY